MLVWHFYIEVQDQFMHVKFCC